MLTSQIPIHLGLIEWQDQITIYPFPFSCMFARRLAFIALLENSQHLPEIGDKAVRYVVPARSSDRKSLRSVAGRMPQVPFPG